MLGAVGLEILKVVGSILVARTTSNPVYGAFAVVVGLLIWINLVSRWMLLVAAWTVTAPFDTDVPPSGTASPEAARKAGIPEEFADHDPDNPPTTVPDGAPAPLAAALQGETPPQDQEEGEVGERAERSRRGGSQQPEALGGDPADVYPEERRSSGAERGNRSNGSAGSDGTSGHAPGSVRLVASESSVRTAGRVSAGMMLAGAAGAALYGAKVLRGTVRSDDD
jgi:hypothetical protein